MVVIAIMTLLTGVFLFQQRQFDSTTLLRSLAYSVALSVRQAQTYGVSVRGLGGVFSQSHGIYVSSGDLSHYYIFSDLNGDYARESDGSEDVETFSLVGQNFNISKFCVTQLNDAELCSDGAIIELIILFTRPNPDACFRTDDSPTACSSEIVYKQASIQLQGPSGVTRSVVITTTGQITVGGVGS